MTKYASRLSRSERDHLAALLGRSLQSVTTDGWAVELATQRGTLRLEPCPMRTPDSEHPIAAVSRPRVLALVEPTASAALREVGRDLGEIRGVLVQTTVVHFSPPRKVRKTKFGGIVLPPGIAYEACFRRPEGAGTVQQETKGAVVDLDVAVEIRTVEHEVLVFTDGTGLFVSLWIDGRASPGWERRAGPSEEVARCEITKEGAE